MTPISPSAANREQPGVARGVHRVRDGVEQSDVAAVGGNRVQPARRTVHPHHRGQIPRRGAQAQRLRTRGHLPLVGDPAAQDVVDQPALGLVLQSGAVPFDHPVQRQCCRSALQHHLRAGRVCGGVRE